MWLRNVPEELLTSLMNHLPPVYQNSQCLLLTTFDLKPTGAEDGTFGAPVGWFSLSEYRPTFMISFPVGRIRAMGLNTKEGR